MCGKKRHAAVGIICVAALVLAAMSVYGCGEEEQADKNTPQGAITEFLEEQGEYTPGSTFNVYKASKEDPDWAIYIEVAQPDQEADMPMFLLHNVDGQWTVLTWGTDIFAEEFGGPSDLEL